ncbi:MAG TPA: hypothetical protein VHE81_22435, partial [Lacipirellulaceae bacterium]|nr:hypothetical protein [Lacipirellulaceae bacterium]
ENARVRKLARMMENLGMSYNAKETAEGDGGHRERLIAIHQGSNIFGEFIMPGCVAAKGIYEDVNV